MASTLIQWVTLIGVTYCAEERPGNLLLYLCQENLMDYTTKGIRYSAGRCAPRSEGTHNATGDELMVNESMINAYDVSGSKPQGHLGDDVAWSKKRIRSCKDIINIGTWNVRTMNQGKLEIVKAEMERNGLDLLGISELKWTQSGHFQSNNHWVYYSGNANQRRNGVAFILNRRLASMVLGYNSVSDRVITLRLRGSPINVTIVQVYSPTTDAEEDEIEQFYDQVQEQIDQTSKQDFLIIMGDFNAKVGHGKEGNIVGNFGLGERNDAGERLIDFCATNKLSIMNTFFQNHKRRLYTWTSPNGVYRNQIDYICVRQRWKSSTITVKTRPGADCGSDHELLTSKVRVKLRKQKKQQTTPKFDLTNIPEEFWQGLHNRFLPLDSEEKEPEELWTQIKTVIIEEAEKTINKSQKTSQRPWLTAETWKIIEERRAVKAKGNKQTADQITRRLKKAIWNDKEIYYQRMCAEIENEHLNGKTRKVYMKIKEIRQKFRPKVGMLKDANGKKMTEPEKIKLRWKEYTEQLYKNDAAGQEDIPTDYNREPNILKDEVIVALRLLAYNKAPGCDNIPVELLRNSEAVVDVITYLCQQIWTTGKWPKDWTRSVLVPIPKKGDTTECGNYRTIALIPHASKIMLKIIQRRLQPYIEQQLSEEQAGFRKGRGTRDIIADLRWIMEKAKEYQKDVYLCFIDYSKAFDCVDHLKLWATLKDMGVPFHLISLMKSLYTEQEATIRTEYGDTEWFRVERGVRQGCILSPFLLNLYAEAIFRKARVDEKEGIRVGGRVINNLRYADDTTLISTSREGIEDLLQSVKNESAKMGLLLNTKKTKILTTSTYDKNVFKMEDDELEVVREFSLLGSMVTFDAVTSPEIKRRIALAKTTMKSLDKVFKSKHISHMTKIRLVHSLVFSVFTYGSECWTIKKQDRRRIDAFEMWCWRRMLSIPWIARRTNKSILEEIKPGISLASRITKLRLAYFGHIVRRDYSLEKDVMMGKTEGSRRRGRPATRWLDTITATAGKTLSELSRLAQDRSSYRSFIHHVAMAQDRAEGR